MLLLLALYTLSAFALETVHNLPAPWQSQAAYFENLSPELVELGQQLFYDPNLSKNRKISCGSCHDGNYAFSNGKALAKGVGGAMGTYNVPVLFNHWSSKIQFWDGRVATLKEQIFHPIRNPVEMDMDDKALVNRLRALPAYRKIGDKLNKDVIEDALASFISSLVSGDSRFDRFEAGDKSALTAEEIKGKDLFFNKYHCQDCHSGSNFTNDRLAFRCGVKAKEAVHYQVKYKVPTLRNLSQSYPYFHNGRLETLEDVLEFYDQPSETSAGMSEHDRGLLIQFLRTLDAKVVLYRAPHVN